MATQESIWFDFQQAVAQAEALEEMAGRIENTVRDELEDGLRAASGAWHGSSASRFQCKGERLGEEIRSNARALRRAAEEVRKVAEQVRRVEMANLATVEERSYNC